MIVTIDGPAGSGKSTAARKLANRLGFIHLNSGALFRAVALKARDQGVPLEDEAAVAAVAEATKFEHQLVNNGANGHQTLLLVDGLDISEKTTTDTAGSLASKIAVLPMLRDVLLEVQREVGRHSSVVLEGRDAGTVVFPYAEVKFYLDAAEDVRAERRLKELVSKDSSSNLTLEGVKRDMLERDHREMTRAIAPLRVADGAIKVDSSALTADEVVELMCGYVEERRA